MLIDDEDIYIDVKKGNSIILDEIKYSEIYLATINDDHACKLIDNLEDCNRETVTMFVVPSKDKKRVENIYLLHTKDLIENHLKLNPTWAVTLLERRKETKRSFACQQSMTVNDLKAIEGCICI